MRISTALRSKSKSGCAATQLRTSRSMASFVSGRPTTMPISLPKWMTCCPAAKRQNQLTDQAPTTSSPVTGDATADPAARASSYRLEVMELSPHSLRLHLLRYRCTLELVPTERCAIMRLTFAESGSVTLQIDLRGTDAELHAEMASG